MTPTKFVDKWGDRFEEAIRPIMEKVHQAGFSVEGPYAFADDSPIFGFSVWQAPMEPQDDGAVDVWWRLEPIGGERPLRYWPALDLIEKGGAGVGSVNFWDVAVNLDDTKMIKQILEGLDTETDYILSKLVEQGWGPRGPREWSPRSKLGGVDRPLRFLHGTSDRAYRKIRREGLVRPYLTDSDAVAAYFADTQAMEDQGHPVILEVVVRYPDILRVDQEMWGEPLELIKREHHIERDQEWFEAMREGHIDTPRNAFDWETSLRMVHAVKYDGTIAPSDIRVAVK